MIRIQPYSLRYKTPFRISSASFETREGALIQWGMGWGDLAPLAGFSTETLSDALEELALYQDELPSIEPLTPRFENWLEQFQAPSLRFALHSAAIHHKAQQQGLSIGSYLRSADAPLKVAVNATLGISTMEQTLTQAKMRMDEGFTTLKIKVGKDVDFESEMLDYIHSAFPEFTLRIDANQAWSVEEAIEILNRWEKFNFEYCEQPVSAEDVLGMKKVAESVHTPIAADESLKTVDDAYDLLNHKAASVFIVKPAVIGSWLECAEINAVAGERGVKTVVTTLLESGIGRAMTAHIAALYGNTDTTHGLSTGNLFQEDVFDDQPYIRFGQYYLPTDIKPKP